MNLSLVQLVALWVIVWVVELVYLSGVLWGIVWVVELVGLWADQ